MDDQRATVPFIEKILDDHRLQSPPKKRSHPYHDDNDKCLWEPKLMISNIKISDIVALFNTISQKYNVLCHLKYHIIQYDTE